MIQKFIIFENKELDPFGEENWEENSNGLPYEYDVNVVIGRRIEEPHPTNQYEISIENMHGDADAYTHKTLILYTIDDLKKAIGFIAYLREIINRGDDYNYEQLENIWETLFDDPPDLDFIEGDVTCDGQRFASSEVEKVVYYNGDGEMFRVNIKTIKIR